ncbi:probable threonine protease PRSS50 [Echinops telfairi]|uniref:Probable threonine protease PRSS50 n=1 Tax=Echinops telfairi TaxID=9371 RepID=A0ABM0INN4_ECHTE|nr:probable threonine protease PRSS50 [Echinops telfairi]
MARPQGTRHRDHTFTEAGHEQRPRGPDPRDAGSSGSGNHWGAPPEPKPRPLPAAPRHSTRMEPWRRTRACGQGFPSLGPSVPIHGCAVFLLLLLRLTGCLGVGEARDALPPSALAHPVPDGPRPRVARQGPTTPAATTTPVITTPITQVAAPTPQVADPTPQVADPDHSGRNFTNHTSDFLPACGFSFEEDPTLRDSLAMTRRWPWIVSVRANGTHICTGTLIAPQWVLVVAHCLVQRNVAYSVLMGSSVIDQPVKYAHSVPVGQVIVNSRYRPRRYWSWIGKANNIGLLKLQSMFKYSQYIWPICLPGLDFEVKEGSICTVIGWGHDSINGKGPQFQSLQEKEVTIMSNKECEQFYHRFSKIPTIVRIINSQMICAEDSQRESFCYEKTGEPLLCPVEKTWYLVGLVSWGPGCDKSDAPPIYLQVSAYQQWIWDRLNGQPLAVPAPPRALLLLLPLPLSLLATL